MSRRNTPVGTTKCICQLCNCGRHSCPHTNGDIIGQGDSGPRNTEYGECFFAKDGGKQQSYRPNDTYSGPEGTFDGDTTNRLDYNQKKADPSKSYKPGQSVYKSDAPFDGDTTHKADFYHKQSEPSKSYKPVQSGHQSNEPLDGMTTNIADYKPWDGRQKADIIRPKSSRHLAEGAFEGTTEHRSSFEPKSGEASKAFKPEETSHVSGLPFDGTTTHRQDYIQKKGQDFCPAEMVLNKRDKSYKLRGDENGHRWFSKISLGQVQENFAQMAPVNG